jgi:hypothetical protein
MPDSFARGITHAGLIAMTLGLVASLAGPRAPAHVVTVVAHDFAFEMPASLPAGLTTFRLLDHGKQSHHFSVMRLDSGKTLSDGATALTRAGHGVRPAWMHPVGGPNATTPGGEASATLVLEPGNYMAFCEVPGPDPMPHFMKGMVKGFTVTGPARAAALPAADASIRLTDYDFVVSKPLTRGRHVIAVTNAGSQPHMLVMNWFPPGQRAGQPTKDFLAWAYDPKGKPGPGRAAGGVTEIAPGATVAMHGTFEPGTYVLICFSPDAADGKPHFMHGMQKEITVR